MVSEDEQKVFDEIINRGCCKRCALRYMGFCKTLITFDHPETCLMNFGFIPFLDEPRTKIRKDNPCIVCLGLLQDEALDEILNHENLSTVAQYESHTYVPYITFPTCILIRDHSMKIHLKKTFPKCFDANNVIKINHAWRYSVENRLSQKLNKTYHHKSKLTLHFYTDYVLEQDEIAAVQNCVSEHLSKHTVVSLLGSIHDETFQQLVRVPPSVPLYEVKVKDLKYFSEAIHLVGNYCKYSRQLPLSSYTFTDVSAENSVEGIILKTLQSVLGDFESAMFKASGFDNQSDRILGKGRTFRVQINDPKFEKVSHSDCQRIEDEIKKTRVIKVKNLREADKRDIIAIMDSETLSTKSYKVLCLVYECKNIDYCVNAVNMYTKITVQQKTPAWLIGQREIKTKKKNIFYIRASRVKDKNNIIELELCAEYSFYVTEFINGDFGRTKPSLGDIMKAKVECLAIDVVDFCSTLPNAIDPEEVRL